MLPHQHVQFQARILREAWSKSWKESSAHVITAISFAPNAYSSSHGPRPCFRLDWLYAFEKQVNRAKQTRGFKVCRSTRSLCGAGLPELSLSTLTRKELRNWVNEKGCYSRATGQGRDCSKKNRFRQITFAHYLLNFQFQVNTAGTSQSAISVLQQSMSVGWWFSLFLLIAGNLCIINSNAADNVQRKSFYSLPITVKLQKLWTLQFDSYR